MSNRLSLNFFLQGALEMAPQLLGKILVRQYEDGRIERYRINETEAYCGIEDLASHASKGRTSRTDVMFEQGGTVYVYLIYGMYWMLNIVAGKEHTPEAVLIRGVEGVVGPGRVGRLLKLDRTFYGEDLATSSRIWIEKGEPVLDIKTSKRVGVDYAGPDWAEKPWRFYY
ncbi:MAG: DNA-3-methyladenine glycosylase [Methylococcaceae bacterium]|nr:DNA-3-methyladenine glycosylase [Prolixibacteraceae bacterium]